MKAAVVLDYSQPPTYADFSDPEPREGFVEVRMLAAGVHQLVRSIAGNAHYSSTPPPFVAGVDGVAELEGERIYTGASPAPLGTIAERTLIPRGFAVPVPAALSTEYVAGIVNPAMSSWLPLSARTLQANATVLVLGATGASGTLAVHNALHFGAARVLAAGRDTETLHKLAANPRVTPVSLVGSRTEVAERIKAAVADGLDLVLDYLWGDVAEATLAALKERTLLTSGSDIDFVQIGSTLGQTIQLDAEILRARRISISGSSGGSVPPAQLLASLHAMLQHLADETPDFTTRVAPLSEVSHAWAEKGRNRLVITTER